MAARAGPSFLLSTRTALLLLLQEGPSYGRRLGERAMELTNGEIVLAIGGVAVALQKMKRQKLIRVSQGPDKREGRLWRRTFYTLTPEGERLAARQRNALTLLLKGTASKRRGARS